MTWTFWPGVVVGIWTSMAIAVLLFIVKELLGPPRVTSIDYCESCGVPLSASRVFSEGDTICFDCSFHHQILRQRGEA